MNLLLSFRNYWNKLACLMINTHRGSSWSHQWEDVCKIWLSRYFRNPIGLTHILLLHYHLWIFKKLRWNLSSFLHYKISLLLNINRNQSSIIRNTSTLFNWTSFVTELTHLLMTDFNRLSRDWRSFLSCTIMGIIYFLINCWKKCLITIEMIIGLLGCISITVRWRLYTIIAFVITWRSR